MFYVATLDSEFFLLSQNWGPQGAYFCGLSCWDDYEIAEKYFRIYSNNLENK